MIKTRSKIAGFTIVELLVVIVVIGILAALTIVSYTGIAQKASAAALKADLSSASTKLELYKVVNSTYPPTKTDAENAGILPINSGTDFQYTVSGGVYSMSVSSSSSGTTAYHITSSVGFIENGVAVGHTAPGVPAVVWKQISAGQFNTCTIGSDNLAYCSGYNAYGQNGDNSITQRLSPVAVNTAGVLSGKTIKAITVWGANRHTCAIASDNLAYCWGNNTNGQLGNNSVVDSPVPVAVDTTGLFSGKTVKSISNGDYNTCTIASDDQAYCWGSNGNYQLGNNSGVASRVPVAVSTAGVLNGKTVKSISTGYAHSCVVASDNLAYCWGYNSYGGLGDNSTTARMVPVAVNTAGVLNGKTILSVSTSSDYTCAIASDNLPYCWGDNSFGQLGNNSTTESHIPVAVTTGALSGKTVKAISAGFQHTCVIASDDQVYCWGYNSSGQLGVNSTTNSLVPVAVNTAGVLNGKTVVSISTGYDYTCAIASDNKPYCWGENGNGQLGINSTTRSLVPAAVLAIP